MPPKALLEPGNPLRARRRNEAVVLLSSASGRIVGFIVDIGRRSIPFANTVAEKYTDGGNILDALMDGSFLPSDSGGYSEIDDMEISDTFYNLGNRLRRSLGVKNLASIHLADLEFLMQHINMTEN